MKILLTLFLCNLIPFSGMQVPVEKIDNKKLIILLKDEDMQLLDVRTPGEVAKGYIEGAVHIDYYGSDFEEKVASLDKNRPVIVYCAAGGRSAKSGEKLKELGFTKIYDLTGGFSTYLKEGYPIYGN